MSDWLVELSIEQVFTFEQADIMRKIRNDCLNGYSNFNGMISKNDQRKWWKKNKDKVTAFLFFDRKTGKRVAFAMLALKEDGKYWMTNGVEPEFRGRGYGKATATYIASKGNEVYSQALKSNLPAIKEHTSQLWQVIGEDNNIVKFLYRGGH